MKIKAAIQELPVVGPTATMEMTLCVYFKGLSPRRRTLGCYAKAEILNPIIICFPPFPWKKVKEKAFPYV